MRGMRYQRNQGAGYARYFGKEDLDQREQAVIHPFKLQ